MASRKTLPTVIARARRENREARLQRLGFPSYSAYLASAEWASIKARYRASDLPQDCICGETERIHLHHVTYERVGKESLSDLTPLCSACHAMIHALESRGEIGLDLSGLVNEQRATRNRVLMRQREAEAQDVESAVREQRLRAELRNVTHQIKMVAVELAREGRDHRPFLRGIAESLNDFRLEHGFPAIGFKHLD